MRGNDIGNTRDGWAAGKEHVKGRGALRSRLALWTTVSAECTAPLLRYSGIPAVQRLFRIIDSPSGGIPCARVAAAQTPTERGVPRRRSGTANAYGSTGTGRKKLAHSAVSKELRKFRLGTKKSELFNINPKSIT